MRRKLPKPIKNKAVLGALRTIVKVVKSSIKTTKKANKAIKKMKVKGISKPKTRRGKTK